MFPCWIPFGRRPRDASQSLEGCANLVFTRSSGDSVPPSCVRPCMPGPDRTAAAGRESAATGYCRGGPSAGPSSASTRGQASIGAEPSIGCRSAGGCPRVEGGGRGRPDEMGSTRQATCKCSLTPIVSVDGLDWLHDCETTQDAARVYTRIHWCRWSHVDKSWFTVGCHDAWVSALATAGPSTAHSTRRRASGMLTPGKPRSAASTIILRSFDSK
jgi:hypothetical protein